MSEARRSRWALVRGAREVVGRLREGWGEMPAGAGRRWAAGLALGTGLTAALLALLTSVAQRRPALSEWDRRLLERIVETDPISFHDAMWWEAFGASSMLVPVVAAAAVVSAMLRRPLLALTFAASYLLAKPLVLVGWTMWDRARPTLVADGIAAPPLNSYPSGHALQTATIYGLLVYLWVRRSSSVAERLLGAAVWLALVTLVALARLRIGAHWPSDVITGSAVGTLWLIGLVLALRRGESAGAS